MTIVILRTPAELARARIQTRLDALREVDYEDADALTYGDIQWVDVDEVQAR